MLVAAGGRLPPGPVKWSRMRCQRGACGALVIPDDRWEPCHLSREGGGGPSQGTDTAEAVARPSREEVLAGSFAEAAATLGLYAWHPHLHFIPPLRCPGYLKPQLFLEAAPAMPRGGGEGIPQPRPSFSPQIFLRITPPSYVPLRCAPLLQGRQSPP